MDFAYICPTAFIQKFSTQGDFIFVLSHLIDLEEENKYEREVRKTRLPVMLDNGLFENLKPEPIETLIRKAVKLKAFAFWSPDYLFDAEKTKEQIDKTFEKMIDYDLVEWQRFRPKNKIKLGAVVQANNKREWIEQFEDFYKDERIDIIGLSILSIPHCFEKRQDGIRGITSSRISCIAELNYLGFKGKDCHLLGLGESYADVRFATVCAPYIKSNDSSSCFTTGLKRKTYTDDMKIPGGKSKKKLNFELKHITPRQKECIQENIKKVKKL